MNTEPSGPDDIGRRLRAARAYAGLELADLADAIGLKAATLARIEAGAEQLSGDDRRAIIAAVASVTKIPAGVFTADFDLVEGEASPTSIAEALGAKIDAALERMDAVIAQAEAQMTRGAEQLDRFIGHQHEDRDLLRAIANQLGVERGD